MDKGAGDDFPMYWVNHAEAEGFCRNITALAQASGELPKDWEFRLPTEAQWEYACRAGTTTATYLGKSMTEAQANFGHRSGQSDKVGRYPANPWALHDMVGNVWEWCRDWYHFTRPGGSDPEMTVKGVPDRDGTYSEVRRGSAWIEEITGPPIGSDMNPNGAATILAFVWRRFGRRACGHFARRDGHSWEVYATEARPTGLPRS